MQARQSESSPRRTFLVFALAVAVIASGLAVYARQSARFAASRSAEARERYEADLGLVSQYRKASADALLVSADTNEIALSNKFLSDTLGRYGITSTTIDTSAPREVPGGLVRIETTIQIPQTPFSAIMGFMHEVEKNRRTLALADAGFTRHETADSWSVKLVYAALAPAS